MTPPDTAEQARILAAIDRVKGAHFGHCTDCTRSAITLYVLNSDRSLQRQLRYAARGRRTAAHTIRGRR